MHLARTPYLQPRPAVLGGLAVAAMAGLLLAFHQVVSGAVQRGEARHAASLARHNAQWGCNQLRGRGLREECRQQLASAAAGPVALQQLVLNRLDRAKE